MRVLVGLAAAVAVAWAFAWGVRLGVRWGREAGRAEGQIIDLRSPQPQPKGGTWINPSRRG